MIKFIRENLYVVVLAISLNELGHGVDTWGWWIVMFAVCLAVGIIPQNKEGEGR